MAYIPYLYLPGPWEADTVTISDEQTHHLRRVLRAGDQLPVAYTDGRGTAGTGTLVESGVCRGDESAVEAPTPTLTVAVAPPHSAPRARFVVEKLAELGVDRLVWLKTEYGQARPPRGEKVLQWAIGALEQSRGSWLMDIAGPLTLADLPKPTWLLHRGGGSLPSPTPQVTLAIGPEGGFSAEELAGGDITVGIGARVLRVETAAVVATGLVLDHLGRMNT